MCLQIITNKEKQETDWMPAWKVMTKKGRMQAPDEFPYENPYDIQGEYLASYKFDTIYQATLSKIFQVFDSYTAGFHCFTTKEDADLYKNTLSVVPNVKTTPVLIKNILCEGIQIHQTYRPEQEYQLKVVVAELIQIPRQTND